MNIEEIKRKAKELEKKASKERKKHYYITTVAWFKYLGLLRHNTIEGRRATVTITQALLAAELEPRIYELLPALLVAIPRALECNTDTLPEDLTAVIDDIKKRRPLKPFRGIAPEKYTRWLCSAVMDDARKRYEFRKMPRKTKNKSSAIGEFVRTNRLRLLMTQREFAQTYQISLRVVRDIEQGKLGASIANVNEILSVFNSKLMAQ